MSDKDLDKEIKERDLLMESNITYIQDKLDRLERKFDRILDLIEELRKDPLP